MTVRKIIVLFFIACGLFNPHMPWYVPKKYFDMFPLDEVTTPKLKEDDLDELPSAPMPEGDEELSDTELLGASTLAKMEAAAESESEEAVDELEASDDVAEDAETEAESEDVAESYAETEETEETEEE